MLLLIFILDSNFSLFLFFRYHLCLVLNLAVYGYSLNLNLFNVLFMRARDVLLNA